MPPPVTRRPQARPVDGRLPNGSASSTSRSPSPDPGHPESHPRHRGVLLTDPRAIRVSPSTRFGSGPLPWGRDRPHPPPVGAGSRTSAGGDLVAVSVGCWLRMHSSTVCCGAPPQDTTEYGGDEKCFPHNAFVISGRPRMSADPSGGARFSDISPASTGRPSASRSPAAGRDRCRF